MSTGKIELSVGATKIANKYELFTEEEVDAINNKIPELDGRVDIIEDEIEEINSSLEQKANSIDVNSKVWSMANMGQDVKEAMTGGSVAVVGVNSVGTTNLQNNSVTNSKVLNVGLEKINNTLISENDIDSRWGDNDELLQYSINSTTNTLHIIKECQGDRGLLFKTVDVSLCKDTLTMSITHRNNAIVSIWVAKPTGSIIREIAGLPITSEYKTSTFTFTKSYFNELGASSFKLLIALGHPNCEVYLKDITFNDNGMDRYLVNQLLSDIPGSRLEDYSVTPQKISNIPYDLITTPSNLPISGFRPWSKGESDQLIISHDTVSFHQFSTGNRGMLTPEVVNADLSKPLKLSFLYRTNSSKCDVHYISPTGEYKGSIQILPKSDDFQKCVITLDPERITSLGIASEFSLIFATHETGAFIEIKGINLDEYGKLAVDLNMHLQNIENSIGNNSKRVEEAKEELTKQLDTKITLKELNIFDIRNAKLLGTTENLVKWGSSNMTITDGKVYFSHTLADGNTGYQLNNLGIKDSNVNITITGTVLDLDGGLSIHLGGKKVGTDATTYYLLKTFFSKGEFTHTVDIAQLFSINGEMQLDTLSIVFSNSGVVNSSITTNIRINLVNNNFKYTEKTLAEALNSIYEDIHKELKYEDIKKTYTYWGTLKNLEPWSGGNFTIEDNVLSFSHTKDTGNSGIITPPFTSKSNFVTVKGNVTNIIKNSSDARMQLYVVGKNTVNGSTTYMITKVITELGEFHDTIDLNNLVVYNSLDLTEPIQILFGSVGNVSVTVEDYAVYEDDLQGADLVGDTLKDTCITFNNQINTIKTKLTEIEESLDIGNNILISPNGTRYLTQVTNEGNLISIPIIPNKTLFIGNSLLCGHGTFGMCATNSKEDYYYHVTQYIKSIKPSATFEKLLGSPFEMAESQQAIDTWIDSNIKNKSKDFDLVIIQLGDNVNNNIRNELFKTSCEYLIKTIRNHSPKARICWVGEWYYSQQRQDIIAKACINTGSTFIDITGLRQFKEYEGNIGDIITRDDGSTFEVVSTGVASHPGNSGMKAIADMIIEELF